ncbi:MAG TPA: class I SAM-dependent methyltransferase [Thermoanaerobaculia bacterium]|nr:class I SAM-dependent methyltransferase [Thermoanaerobaculia bacterium]
MVDLGCGFGWHWVEITAANPEIRFVLVDFALPNLQVCRNLMPVDSHPNVLCVQASILDLPIRNGAATLAWSVQVMQHIADPERTIAFREARRILKPRGAFYIAWVRAVPMMSFLSRLIARHYHQQGRTQQGLYLDRFDDGIRDTLLGVFPSGRVTRSESLFHPELRLRPRANWVGTLDLAISRSPIGTLIARQAEFSGEA